jgi:hypothetical protein
MVSSPSFHADHLIWEHLYFSQSTQTKATGCGGLQVLSGVSQLDSLHLASGGWPSTDFISQVWSTLACCSFPHNLLPGQHLLPPIPRSLTFSFNINLHRFFSFPYFPHLPTSHLFIQPFSHTSLCLTLCLVLRLKGSGQNIPS